ncbi:MAG: class I SAM-dependent methyltransferase, partial [Planctomycetota bacterium]
MSRLESAIRRLMAQKSTLDWAAAEVAGRDGPVLELGLGNGRTYDHLRHILPNRPIYVFEREVAAHPDCVPPDNHLFLGDVMVSLPRAAALLGPTAVLAHVDI